jgi:tetratricopeptide (TPR) repeat protein
MNKILCLVLALSLGALSSCSDSSPADTGIPGQHLDQVARKFNHGIGMMERYQPAEAVTAFKEVVRLAPDWAPGRLNLGIALLNRNDKEAFPQAEAELQWVVDHEPDNPYALFSLGMLLRYIDRSDEAEVLFERVLQVDPDDADAHYQLGVLKLDSDATGARLHLEQTLAQVPHHQSACYRLAALYRKAGEPEHARELLDRFRDLKDAEAGVTAGMKYGEMGRYANVIRAFDDPVIEPDLRQLPVFTNHAAALNLNLVASGEPGWPGIAGPGVAVADVDGDRDLDVYLPGSAADAGAGAGGAGTGAETVGTLLLQTDGEFTAHTQSGIDGSGAIGAFFGDFDKDGDPDLFLSRRGPDRLYRNDGGGHFTDITDSAGLAGPDSLSLGAVWADADHDGDLDLLVARYQKVGANTPGAPNSLWRNNGDGTFIDVAPEAGLSGGDRASLSVVLLDLDQDRDLDLIFLHQGADNQILLNDRVGLYREASAQFPALASSGDCYGIVSGDLDRDGRIDLLMLKGAKAPQLLLQKQVGVFVPDSKYSAALDAFQGAAGACMGDFDLDGDLDLILLDAGTHVESDPATTLSYGHWFLARDRAGTFHPPVAIGQSSPEVRARGAVAADFNGDGSLDLLIARAGAKNQLWSADAKPESHWLEVLPSQKTSPGPAPETTEGDALSPEHLTWADPGAPDLMVEVKTGQQTQLRWLNTSTGYLGSAPRRLHFGLGAAEQADYVRLSWLDAVLQSELEVPAGQLWQINKIKRKPSSCPILFSWDGQRFAYVTDFLGTGGLGFFVAPGEFAPPDPTEDVRIPPKMVAPNDGRYLLRVTEPLEEVTYLDQLNLQVYDHPQEWEVHPDERFTGTAPFPTGQPIAIAEKIFPATAVSDTGVDLIETLHEVDRKYAEPPRDPRFPGYARDHWIELDFGERLRDRDTSKPLILMLHGWVEYTYSHINYAAWQAGITMQSPWIEIPDGQGGWRKATTEMGFPAGLPRMMTYDISNLPLQKDGRLRIRTNMEIFWDQIYAANDVSADVLIHHELQPIKAELRTLGYPREYSPDGADPTMYDYHRLDLGVPFKNMGGSFTSHGDVRELLRQVDDQFVILARGEEVALEFDATTLPPLADGWARTLVLHSDGYCKDMDLYTAYPDTVEPLPFHEMRNYPPAKPTKK